MKKVILPFLYNLICLLLMIFGDDAIASFVCVIYAVSLIYEKLKGKTVMTFTIK